MNTPQLSFALVLALLVSACGGTSSPTSPSTPSTPTPTPAPVAVSVTSLIVNGNGCSGGVCVAPGPLALTAIAQLSNGTTQSVTSQASWTSSNPNVASVNGSGAIAVLNAGDTDVLATYQGRSAGQTIRVPEPWSQSGQGDTVFQMPTFVRQVRIIGTYGGRCQNFVAKIAGRIAVNEILGTCSVAIGPKYEGVQLTSGGTVQTEISSGVSWSFAQVR
jgi:Big-like domain-containing protein